MKRFGGCFKQVEHPDEIENIYFRGDSAPKQIILKVDFAVSEVKLYKSS